MPIMLERKDAGSLLVSFVEEAWFSISTEGEGRGCLVEEWGRWEVRRMVWTVFASQL